MELVATVLRPELDRMRRTAWQRRNARACGAACVGEYEDGAAGVSVWPRK